MTPFPFRFLPLLDWFIHFILVKFLTVFLPQQNSCTMGFIKAMQNQRNLSSLWWAQPCPGVATTPQPSHSQPFTISATSCFSFYTIRQFPQAPILQIPGRVFNTHLDSRPPFMCPPSFERCQLTPLFYSPPPFFPSFLSKQWAKAKNTSCMPHCNFAFLLRVSIQASVPRLMQNTATLWWL